MARERRTNFTLPERDTPKRAVGKRTTTRVHTGPAAAIGATAARERITRRKKSPVSFTFLFLVLVIGGGGYYYVKEHNAKIAQERADGERARLAKAEKLRKDEEQRAADIKAAAASAAADARRKKLEEDKQRAAAELAKFKPGGAKKKTVAAAEETAEEVEIIEASEEFLASMKEAKTLLRKGEWEHARKKYSDTSVLPAPEELQAQARGLSAAAKMFENVESTTRPAIEASAENMFIVTLKSGVKIRGKLDRDKSGVDDIAFVKDGGAVQRLIPAEIVKKVPVTQEQRNAQMVQELEERKAKAKDSGVAWYQCGVKALEFNQKPIAIECFATAADKDPAIARSVMEFLASRLFASAMLDRNMKLKEKSERKIAELKAKYPKSRAAMMIDGTLAEADALAAALAKQKEERLQLAKLKKEEAARARAERRQQRNSNKDLAVIEDDIAEAMEGLGDDPVGSTEIAKADGLASNANNLMKTAQTCDNRDTANKNYKEALSQLRQAAALYKKMLESKSSPVVERKLDEVQKNMYWCRKLQTV